MQTARNAQRITISANHLSNQNLLKRSNPTFFRPFHSSKPILGAGESDIELSTRLAQEIEYERENNVNPNESSNEPAFLTNFRSQGIWKIEDQPGSDEIALIRDFGNEHIRVLFSIGDIGESAEADEMEESEDMNETKEEEEETPAFPVRCAITISKQSQGALTIDAQAIDGSFTIENISFYKDAKLATDLTAEADWARRGLYIGPQFDTLDQSVQEQFEHFLEERGIATELALFIPNFAEFKEQREYCAWLENVKAFVDA
ncbi:mitochondrial glyco protein [Meira miltonrushii]|uniref:Mitochondrial glyco protein n=1 Tax=Meira miltonrushii TaxID=1280837 RepID=A0A316V1B9_9BASI|nr:mitochondrial glyco protein [Meira miltonrushii]PWN31346.1 mitochondrial glyco protein [Meira miltonrushii]